LFKESLGLSFALGRVERSRWFFVEVSFLKPVRNGADLESIELHQECFKNETLNIIQMI
jgi:hypothetical protein